MHASSRIRTHDPSVRASEDSSCLIRPRGHCDGLFKYSACMMMFPSQSVLYKERLFSTLGLYGHTSAYIPVCCRWISHHCSQRYCHVEWNTHTYVKGNSCLGLAKWIYFVELKIRPYSSRSFGMWRCVVWYMTAQRLEGALYVFIVVEVTPSSG
jgi:hypothetical protein